MRASLASYNAGDICIYLYSQVIDDRVVNLDQCSPDVAPGAILSRRERISLTFRVVKHVAVPADEFVDAATQDEIARRREWWAHAVSEKRS